MTDTSPIMTGSDIEGLIARLRNGDFMQREGFAKAADALAKQSSALSSLRAENEELSKALEFYRDGWVFKTSKKWSGLEWFPTEELLDDCGNTARSVLAARGTK